MPLLAIDKSGHVAIVTARTNRSTRYITSVGKKRKLVTLRNVDFDSNFQLYADDPSIAAAKWLATTSHLTLEVQKELQMVVAMKKNVVIGKFDSIDEIPSGTEYVEGPEDLKGRTVKSLTALFNKLTTGEPVKQFGTLEEATVAVWGAMESFEPPVKEKKAAKEKVVREKFVPIALPAKIGKASTITVNVENPKREGTSGYKAFSKYVNGMTVGEYLALDGVSSADLRWDASHGFITIDYIDDPVKEKVVKEKVAKEPKAKKAKKEAAPEE